MSYRGVTVAILLVVHTVLLRLSFTAQIQNSQWLFGANCSLNLLTNPPSSIPGSNIGSSQGSANISDDNGNLLFYTDGASVKNRFHNVMSNGTGLFGFSAGFQSCLITKQPGSSHLYYIFTVRCDHDLPGLTYSIVDMNLSAGAGSVTIKNAPIYTDSLHERLTGTKHCNGRDYWIIVNRYHSATFRAYLLTPTGISGPVISVFPPIALDFYDGPMHVSPTGNKIALVNYVNPISFFIYDFDISTGQMSNRNSLPAAYYVNSCAFSPDGTKLYACGSSGILNRRIYQWDLCAGMINDIRNSKDSFNFPPALVNAMQLAPDNKVYILSSATPTLSVINNPNANGLASNFTFQNLPINGSPGIGLPNMITSYNQNYTQFTYSLALNSNCHAISFTAAPSPTQNCMSATNYSVTHISWNFGDAASANSNTSLAQQPVHIYSSSGTYTAMQIFHKTCSNDTVKQVVIVPKPDLLLSVGQVSCNTPVPATVTANGGLGPYTFNWLPSQQSGSVVSLNPGTYTVTISDQGLGCSVNSLVIIPPTAPPALTVSPSATVIVCQGEKINISVAGGGTSYTWAPSNGISASTGTSTTFNGNVSKVYTVSTKVNACIASSTISLIVTELPKAQIIGKTKLCRNDSLILQGFGGAKYEWFKNFLISNNQTFRTLLNSNYQAGTYTLIVTDSNGCKNNLITDITFSDLPWANIGGPMTGCAPFCGNYSINYKTLNATATINPVTLLGQSNQKYCFAAPGIYTISLKSTDTITGCSNLQEYEVQVHQKPNADFIFIPKQPIEGVDEVIFSALQADNKKIKYTWFLPEKIQANGDRFEKLFMKSGNYPVVLVCTNEYDCSDTIIKTLTVAENFAVYIPNTFTPNGDTHNETFYPVLLNVKKYQFRIYNRWGKEIFSSSSPEAEWDGKFNGADCPEDVYSWTIYFTTVFEESRQMSGQVLLER